MIVRLLSGYWGRRGGYGAGMAEGVVVLDRPGGLGSVNSRPMWLGFTEQRLIALRRTLARPREVLGWDPVQPPGTLSRGYPARITDYESIAGVDPQS
jgi:hypothetical protein